jgi:tetratricopeptide (TPR) repeat protein
VDVAVEGAVLRSDGRVRITVQLIDADTDRHLWAESYERPVDDILRLQHAVAQDVALAIHRTLCPGEQVQLGAGRRVDPDAHEAYLMGRYFWHKRTPEAMARSVEWFRLAVEHDPACAPAYAGLAHAQGAAGFFGYAPAADAFGQMRSLASLALSLDGDLAEGHAALGAVRLFYDWDWRGAEAAFQRALNSNPSDAIAHEWFGWCLFALGRPAKAIAELRRARDLDPVSARAHASLAMALYFARRHADALAQLQRAVELDPFFVDARCGLGLNYEQLSRMEDAIAQFERAMALAGRIPPELASLGHALGLMGRKDEARQLLAELDAQRAVAYVPAVYSAAICAALGERDEAFRRLERAYDERSSWLVFLHVEPWWDSLRDDLRYHDLVRRVGLCNAPPTATLPPKTSFTN